MYCTATTVKDSPENVAFFVRANLASGVDHMFVFLDAPREDGQAEVAAALDEHPRVTCIRTGKGWWAGDRPASLNVRQRINANWVRAVLAPYDWAEWLFHVDGDEVAALDHEALAAVPAGVDAVWLTPWEAVSEWETTGRPTRFKRLLDDPELNLLHVLGTLPEPTNQAYFHGHVLGKSGVRPGSGLGLTLHEGVSADGVRQPRHEDPRLHVLHYDAPSGQEFVRKWTALASAGPARYRPSRQPSARALKALLSSDLDPEVREKYLRRIYDLTTRDDVETLAELGLLVETDPVRGGHRPRELPAGAAEQLAQRVAELSAGPKAGYYVEDAAAPAGRPSTAKEGLKRLVRRP